MKWGHNEPTRTAFLVIGAHATWIALAFLVSGGEEILASTFGRPYAGLVLTPLLVALAAITQTWWAAWPGDLELARADLVEAGASPETAKAFYWSGAPFAYLATVAIVLALVAWFPGTSDRPVEESEFETVCGDEVRAVVTSDIPLVCGPVVRVIDKVARDPQLAKGTNAYLVVDGYECIADRGVVNCIKGETQFSFELKRGAPRPGGIDGKIRSSSDAVEQVVSSAKSATQ